MTIKQRMAIRYVRTKFKILSSLSKTKAAEKAFELFSTPQFRFKKQLPPIFEQAEKIHFKFDGETIRGYRFNHPSEKKLLITHGFESSVLKFDKYIKPFIKKGYEVLAFDAPAHGESTGKRVNALVFKEVIHHINKEYGPIQNFMGHSFGGLALSLYLDEHKHDDSYKLVLIAPAAETTTAVDNFFAFLRLDQDVRKEFDLLIQKKSGKPPAWFSVARALKNIKARVLFLQDKKDSLTPISDVEPIMREEHPHVQFRISEGLGHSRIYRDQGSFNAIVDFF
jgi:pimeloyl-ACP methyl ester carboxylesterase